MPLLLMDRAAATTPAADSKSAVFWRLSSALCFKESMKKNRITAR